MTRIRDRLFELPAVYRAWQAPFVEQKLSPLLKRGEIERAKRVLDVGCGPGTNTRVFDHADYLGVDINGDYIETARKHFGRRFLRADVVTLAWPPEERFDFVLLNSLLHHLSPVDAARLLKSLSRTLAPEGCVHVVDLVLPERRLSLPWMLARLDRGDFARPLADLRALVAQQFDIVDVEQFHLRFGGLRLWDCVYIKARVKLADANGR
jgi:SAM-dependent methyltransferase